MLQQSPSPCASAHATRPHIDWSAYWPLARELANRGWGWVQIFALFDEELRQHGECMPGDPSRFTKAMVARKRAAKSHVGPSPAPKSSLTPGLIGIASLVFAAQDIPACRRIPRKRPPRTKRRLSPAKAPGFSRLAVAADRLEIPRARLVRWMEQKGWIRQESGWHMAEPEAVTLGVLENLVHPFKRPDGTRVRIPEVFVTAAGLEQLASLPDWVLRKDPARRCD